MGIAAVKRRIRRLGVRAVTIACLVVPPAASSTAAAEESPMLRVRSSDPSITELIELASARSQTLRNLVALIQTSDGIVHVEPGVCGHGARACLVIWMSATESARFLRVIVNRKRASSDRDFVGSIGHELQHTVEALSDPGTVDSIKLYNFFSREGRPSGTRFETDKAIKVGNAIRDELGRQRLR
jgi:hypothetical protein